MPELIHSGWESLKLYFKESLAGNKAVPGAVIAIQTFGDFTGFIPHLHVLTSDGCFHASGLFTVAPAFDKKTLEKIFVNVNLTSSSQDFQAVA